ncbi:MAG TPA: hypothetical protein VJN70_15685 [Gemmatimonadaceae bacterium]|nr:hypothetical protein [Gemmatimonadaceae bacterium]
MRRTLVGAMVLLTAASSIATAQAKPTQAGEKKAAGLTWSDLVGDWEGQSLRGKSDSVITPMTISFSADKKASITYPNREPVPMRVVTIGGDSVVVEAGPYPSVTRAGHTVVSLHEVAHIANHKMTGSFNAKFDDGQTIEGTTKASHKMK